MKLQYRIAALFVGLLVLISLCGCDDSRDSLERILKKQEIVFGIAPESAPMSFESDGGAAQGLAVDIGKGLAERLAVTPSFVFVKQEDALQSLTNEEIDCYLCMISSDIKLASQMQNIDSQLVCRSVVITPAGSKISRLVDIKGKKVCTVSGSDAEAAFDAAPVMKSSCAQVEPLGSLEDAIASIDGGQYDAAVVDETRFLYLTRDSADKYSIVGESVRSDDYVLAMRLRDTALSERLGLLYADMIADGSVEAAKDEWFGR